MTVNTLDSFISKELKSKQNRFKTTIENIFQNNSSEDTDTDTDSKKIITSKSKNGYSVSSGRIQTWINSLDVVFKNKKIIGYGPQADRYVLSNLAENHLEASWSNNSSNAIIYSILCFGVFVKSYRNLSF